MRKTSDVLFEIKIAAVENYLKVKRRVVKICDEQFARLQLENELRFINQMKKWDYSFSEKLMVRVLLLIN